MSPLTTRHNETRGLKDGKNSTTKSGEYNGIPLSRGVTVGTGANSESTPSEEEKADQQLERTEPNGDPQGGTLEKSIQGAGISDL